MKPSIIIPAYNEAESIGAVIDKIKALHPTAELIVVNDGSTDHTAEIAYRAGAAVYSHPYNIGNGAAIKTGIRKARGDVFVFMDGDGQHDPRQIQQMLDCFPEYDMVVGQRERRGQASFKRAIGNLVFNQVASYVAKFSIKDLTSGFRAVKADIARSYIYLLPNTYSYPTTITLGVLRLKYIPIKTCKRQGGNSGIHLFRDGVRFLMIMTKICTLYSPMRVFLPVSFAMFSLGGLRYLYSYFTQGRFTNMSALLFMTSLLVFMMGLISEQICQMRFERRTIKRRMDKFKPQ